MVRQSFCSCSTFTKFRVCWLIVTLGDLARKSPEAWHTCMRPQIGLISFPHSNRFPTFSLFLLLHMEKIREVQPFLSPRLSTHTSF